MHRSCAPHHFIAAALLIAAPMLLFLPFMRLSALTFAGNLDALYYTNLLSLATQAIKSGNLWPGWLADANAGLGAPGFLLYPSLPYLLTGALTLAFPLFNDDPALRLMAGIYFAQAAGGIAAWLWLRRHFNGWAAFAGALLYALAPYKLVYLYLHVNLAQFWALAWLPLWMMAAERLGEKTGGRAMAAFALCAALTVYSHPFTFLAFAPLAGVYALWRGRGAIVPTFATLAAAGALTAALTAAYAISFVTASAWITHENFFAGKFNAINNLGHVDTLFFLPYLLIAPLAWFSLKGAGKQRRAEAIFFSAALALSYLLTMRISAPVWEAFAPMQALQFPAARLHAGMLICAIFLFSALLSSRARILALPLAVLAIGASLAGVFSRIDTVYKAAENFTPAYVQDVQRHAIMPFAGYRTQWSTLDGPEIFRRKQEFSALPFAWVHEGIGKVTAEKRFDESIDLRAYLPRGGTVIVRQFYTPGWGAIMKHSTTFLAVYPSAKHGFLQLTLPPSPDTREIRLTWDTREIRASRWISLLALLIVVFLLLPRKYRI